MIIVNLHGYIPTSVFFTVCFDSQEIFVLRGLMYMGCPVNGVDHAGKSALHYQKHTAVVEMLVELGADVDLQDHLGDSPLHVSARTGQTAVAKILLEGGAMTSKMNKSNETALDIAGALGHMEHFKCVLIHARMHESGPVTGHDGKILPSQ